MIVKIKMWFLDHWHLLFKSAADNHLRIQSALKNPDGTYQMTLKFDSYTQLKKYQKKLRTITVSLSSSVAMVVVAVIAAPYIINPNRSSASSFQWSQTNWGTHSTNPDLATTNNKMSWNQFFSKDDNIAATQTGISLAMPAPLTVQEDLDADFAGTKTGDGFYTDGSGKLLLKKPVGSSCVIGTECASATCTTNVCS